MRLTLCVLLLAACSIPATKFTPGSTSGSDAGLATDGGGGGGDSGGGSGDAGMTQTPAMLSASPSGDIALGTVVMGGTSAESTVTISNDGDKTSGKITVSLDDTTLGFAITHDGCSATSLDGHGTCTFGLTFTPVSSGAVQTNVHITADPGGDLMKVVSATGLVQGQIDITDASYAFGNQGLGATMATKVFTVRNTGQTQIGTPMPSTSGGDPSYKVQATTCTAPLAPSDTCTVTIQFAPTTVGSKAGSLVVSASPGGSDAASLSGTAFAHVAVTANGSGTITSSPTGISCPGTCAADFTSSPVTLTAAASATATFAGWGGDCSGSSTGTCSLTLNGAKNVTANFSALAPAQIDITDASYAFANQALGATTATKVFTVRNTGQLQSGVPMPSTASGDPSYKVLSTTCTAPLGPADTCTVTVQFAPASVGAKAGKLVVSASPGGSDMASLTGTAFAHVAVTATGTGTITSSPAGISCPGTCAADFTSSPVTLTESPGANQTFAGWSGDCSGTGSCSLTLNAPKNVTGTFSPTLHPVTVSFTSGNTSGTNTITSSPAGINCNGSTGCTGMFPYGSMVTLTANPDASWGRFVSWSSGPCVGSTNPVCTFTIPAASTTLAGSFTWFATMTILANQGYGGNSPTPSQVNSSDGTLACTHTTTLAGTCVMHFAHNASVTFTYYGNPPSNWSECPFRTATTVRTLKATASGSCQPPAGSICVINQPCPDETCTMSFTSPGDYTSGYNVSCVTTTVSP